jgi:hypothetical protein
LDVALVLDTAGASTAAVDSAKGAAIDFLRTLPSGVRVAILGASPPAVIRSLTADRSAAGTGLAAVTSGSTSDVTAVLAAARAELGAGASAGRRPAIIDLAVGTAASGSAASGTGASSAPATGASRLQGCAICGEGTAGDASGGVPVYAVSAVDGAAPALTTVANPTGGLTLSTQSAGLVGAFDTLLADLAGQYDLAFTLPAESVGSIDLSVDALGISAKATLPLAPASPPAGGASPSVEAPTGAGAPAPSPAQPTKDTGNDTPGWLPWVAFGAVALVGAAFVASAPGRMMLRRLVPSRRGRPAEPVGPVIELPATPALAEPMVEEASVVDLRTPFPTVVLSSDEAWDALAPELEGQRVDAVHAVNAADALEAVLARGARVLLVDLGFRRATDLVVAIRMGEHNGTEPARVLAFLDGGPDTPTNVRLRDDAAERLAETGVPVDAVLSYPLRVDEVVEAIRRLGSAPAAASVSD